MELFEAIRNRRSIRRFTSEPVSRSQIETILEAGLWAPTACNSQLWRFLVLTRDSLGQLADCARNVVELDPAACIFVLYDRRYNPEHSARAQSAAAAIQNMLLAAHGLGLGTLWMCGYGDEARIKRVLGVPEAYEIMAAVLIGHSDESFFAPARRPMDEVVGWDRFVWRGEAAALPRDWHPRSWTYGQVQRFVNYAIRAKSPSPVFNRPFLDREFEAELALIPELEGKTLFFGPYAGNYLFALEQGGRIRGEVEAMVYAPEIGLFLKEKAKDMGLDFKCRYRVFDGRRLPHEDESVDIVFCAHQLERFASPGPIVDEFQRVLRPGGRLVLLISNAYSLYYLLWRFRRLIQDMGPGLRGPFGPLFPGFVKRVMTRFQLESRHGVMLMPFTRYEGFSTRGPLRLLCKSWVSLWRRK